MGEKGSGFVSETVSKLCIGIVVKMTRHWDTENLDDCRGCRYLLRNGIPEEKISDMHYEEIDRLAMKKAKELVLIDRNRLNEIASYLQWPTEALAVVIKRKTRFHQWRIDRILEADGKLYKP